MVATNGFATDLPAGLSARVVDAEARIVVLTFRLARCACLTAAELEVARSAVAGMSNDAIARARRTSVRTVANQIASILRKLAVRSRAELTTIGEILA